MSFTRKDVLKVASLARLDLTETEIDAIAGQLAAVLQHFEQLNELDLDDVEPMAHCLPLQNVFREDAAQPNADAAERSLKNAPKRVGEFFSVPPILDH